MRLDLVPPLHLCIHKHVQLFVKQVQIGKFRFLDWCQNVIIFHSSQVKSERYRMVTSMLVTDVLETKCVEDKDMDVGDKSRHQHRE